MLRSRGSTRWITSIRPRLCLFAASLACTLSAAACGEDSVHDLARDLREGTVVERRRAAARLKDDAKHASLAVPSLIVALRDPDDSVRSFAARALGAIGTPARAASMPLLEFLMTEESPLARHFAVTSLGLIQPESSEVAAAVLKALETKRIYWSDARSTLSRMGPWGASEYAKVDSPVLLARLVLDNGDVSALERFEALGAEASDAVPLLAEIIGRPDVSAEQRDAAARLLGVIGPAASHATKALEAAAAAGSTAAARALLRVRGK